MSVGIFIVPEIRKLFADENFSKHPNAKELEAWKLFKLVAESCPGKHKGENYTKIVENKIKAFRCIGI